jgi:NitT/TauT family transport system ATP-binding protein
MNEKLRIGFIPLVDATALLVAVDAGFTAAEGLDVELIREVSWSNVRDKLNIGLFDAAHLLSPGDRSSLGIGHVRVPLVVPFNLGINGNAITVFTLAFSALSGCDDGDLTDPKVSARALSRIVSERKARGLEPLNFGMTFPFSHHNYQLRYWMAAGGIDPDEDVRLVVLPPPYMVESLASKQVDVFCVGAPWNSVAVDLGVGSILHFGREIMTRVSEKVFCVTPAMGRGKSGHRCTSCARARLREKFVSNADNRATVCAYCSASPWRKIRNSLSAH